MNYLTAQRGYILLPVMIAMTLIAAIAFMISSESGMENNMAANEFEAAKAEYVAQAGMQHGLRRLNQQGCGPFTDLTAVSFGNAEYSTNLQSNLATTTPYTIDVDQDGWIRNDVTDLAHPADTALHIRYETGIIERPVFRYDISSIPAGSSILSATARFYVNKEHPEGPVDIHLLTKDWTEAEADWDLLGDAIAPSVLATIPTQSSAGVWVSVNLTAQVQAWVNGQPNFGLAFNSQAEGTHAEYSSKESVNVPVLEVVVGTPSNKAIFLKSKATLPSGVERTIVRPGVALYQQPSSFTRLTLGPNNGRDAWIDSFYSSRNYGNDSLDIDSSGTQEHALLKFDLPTVPIGARISSATLELYHTATDGTPANPGADVHRVTRDWVEGTTAGSGTADGVTWDTWDGNTNWNQGGGDFNVKPVASSDISVAVSDWETWDVRDLVQGWVDGTYPNHGLLLKATGTIEATFLSKEETDPLLRPKLTITYTCECGAVCMSPQGSGKIVMVVVNPTTLVPSDAYKKSLFESWGYEVSVLSESANQDGYDAAVAASDVVFISETVNSNKVGSNLVNAPIGIVSQDGDYNADLGFALGSTWKIASTINIADNSHYITQPFASGDLQIFTADMEQLAVNGTEAADLKTLADTGGIGSLTVLDTGAAMAGGGNAAGRRVMLPLGRDSDFNYQFNWEHLNQNGRLLVHRALQWGIGVNEGSPGTILLVSGGTPVVEVSSGETFLVPTAQEQLRIDLLESWGYTVNLIDDSASQVDFDAAIALANVAYVAEDITSGELGTKLRDATIGVVIEEEKITDEFGIATGEMTFTEGSIEIVDNTHYITQLFSLGTLNFATSAQPVGGRAGTPAPALVTLGQRPSSTTSMLDLIETGGTLSDSGTAAGRRVKLPWGGNDFDFAALTDDGRTILKRAIEWGMQKPDAKKPIAHWKLDEISGTTANDSEGGHHGSIATPQWTPAQLDGGLLVEGIDANTVSVPHSDALTITDKLTVAAWIFKKQYLGYDAVISKASVAADQNYFFGTWENQVVFGFATATDNWQGYYSSAANLAAGNWYHIAATFDNPNDRVKLYLDGVLIDTFTSTLDPMTNTGDVRLGRSAMGEYWMGILDDVRLYNDVLNEAEITELATAPEPKGTILLVVADAGNLTSGETVRKSLFESWNYKVAIIDDSDSEAAYGVGLAASDVVFVSESITDTSLNSKLKSATIGIVNEDPDLHSEFGFSTVRYLSTDNSPLATDATHYITEPFGGATILALFSSNQPLGAAVGTLPSGLKTIGTWSSGGMSSLGGLLTLENGAVISGGGNAAGRRVQTPWGGADGVSTTDISALTADGQTVLRRALEWASGDGAGGGGTPPDPGSGPCLTSATYRDNFDAIAWNGTNGSLNWSASPWVEVGESDGAASGDVQIMQDVEGEGVETHRYKLRIQDKQNGGEGVKRAIDLGGAGSSTLEFNYRRTRLDNSKDYVAVSITTEGIDAPEASWVELDQIGTTNEEIYQTYTRDISAYISANTAIRLRSSSSMGVTDRVWFDNVEISCSP